MLALWIYEKETLQAMLEDAQRVMNAPVNQGATHEELRAECKTAIDAIRLELAGRGT